MESVPLLWRTVAASPVGTEPMTGGGAVRWTVRGYLAVSSYRCVFTHFSP